MKVIFGTSDCEKTNMLRKQHPDAIFMDLTGSNITADYALTIGMCDAMAVYCQTGQPTITEVG